MIVLLAECSLEGEWEGQVRHLPLSFCLGREVGLDPNNKYVTPTGRPIRLANDGTIVRELFK